MKYIMIKGLAIQFDSDQVTFGGDIDQARKAIDLINGVLQREPYGLAAQVFGGENISDSNIEVEKNEDDKFFDS